MKDSLSLSLFTILFFTIHTPVDFMFLIGKHEHMGQLLLDGGDAAGIFAADDVGDFLRQAQRLFLRNLSVPNNIDSDFMFDKAQHIQIDRVQAPFYFNNILAPHFRAAGILDNRHLTVQMAQSQMLVDVHTFPGRDMVQDDAFL